MCSDVPGKPVETQEESGLHMAEVDFAELRVRPPRIMCPKHSLVSVDFRPSFLLYCYQYPCSGGQENYSPCYLSKEVQQHGYGK